MKMMSARLKSGLSLLLMLLVFAVSSEAAVCELACGLEAQSVGCHMPAAPSTEAAQSLDMPVMSHSHCTPAMHESGMHKTSTAHARTASFTSAQEMKCPHDFAPAIEGTSATSFHLAAIHWTVVEVVPVATMLPDSRRTSCKSLPQLYPPPNSLLIALRV
jgi:hypothetical protein